jgi:hypothetical protein
MPIGKVLSDGNPDGVSVGQSASDLIALYGGTPASQRASSIQVASALASSADFGATQLAVVQEIMNTLTAIGAWKGSA